MAKKLDVYMPLMVGDWLKGTRGMRADVRGVYLGLLLYQWDNGFIPADVYDLELIEPEVNKVWVSLKDKFKEVSPGKLQNEKLEEVRAFFQKQRKNGESGGRPKKENPKQNPNGNPNTNPKPNLHNELDLEYESENDSEKGGGPGEVPRATMENEGKTDFTKPDVDGDKIIFPINSRAMRDLWSGWKQYRWRAHRARYPIMGEQADLRRLNGMTFPQIEKTILTAIANNWKNLYPENGKANTNSKQQQSTNARDYLRDYYARKIDPGGSG